jgi:hypothetical protein
MMNMKCSVIHLIIGTTGIVTKGLKDISGSNTRKHSMYFENSCTGDIEHKKESATV